MKSWKIGAIAGLIAGIAFAVGNLLISIPITFELGFAGAYSPLFESSFTKIASIEIAVNIILGIIYGVIYSRAYRIIPGKGFLKGLTFGLFGILICNIYFAIINLPYSMFQWVGFYLTYGISGWIAYGLVLGISYEILQKRNAPLEKEPKIIEYAMKGGIIPGGIAGALGGLGTFFTVFFFIYTGIWSIYPKELIDLTFIIGQLGTQIMIHLIPGIYLGAIYAKAYNLVPGKGVIKGLVYGLIATFLMNEFRALLMNIFYGYIPLLITVLITGITVAIIFGLVLGLLYRKPTK